MSVKIDTEPSAGIIYVYVSGKLTRKDFAYFVPEIEDFMGQGGKVRVLFDMHDFHGWEPLALWEDIKFDLHHHADIDRLAMVGEKKWQQGMAKVCSPFTAADIRYFTSQERDEARAWLHEGRPQRDTRPQPL